MTDGRQSWATRWILAAICCRGDRFMVLAVPFAVFVSFLSVGMRISKDFLDLHPGYHLARLLMKFGPRFLHICLGFFILLSWVYFAGMESSRWRATLGKRALSLYVADSSRYSCDVCASERTISGRTIPGTRTALRTLLFYDRLRLCRTDTPETGATRHVREMPGAEGATYGWIDAN